MSRFNSNSDTDIDKLPLVGGNLTGNVTVDAGITVDGIDVGEIPTTYLPLSGGVLTGNVDFDLASIPVAANNAAAALAGVNVGGLFRTDADPSVLMIRTV